MSKELEALKNIRDSWNCCNPNSYGCDEKDFALIETALKDYEMEHTLRIRLENINYELIREKQDNDKKLKALEILKEKQVNISRLMICKSAKEHNARNPISDHLSQEEYDLLKEVLL